MICRTEEILVNPRQLAVAGNKGVLLYLLPNLGSYLESIQINCQCKEPVLTAIGIDTCAVITLETKYKIVLMHVYEPRDIITGFAILRYLCVHKGEVTTYLNPSSPKYHTKYRLYLLLAGVNIFKQKLVYIDDRYKVNINLPIS